MYSENCVLDVCRVLSSISFHNGQGYFMYLFCLMPSYVKRNFYSFFFYHTQAFMNFLVAPPRLYSQSGRKHEYDGRKRNLSLLDYIYIPFLLAIMEEISLTTRISHM